MSRIGKTGYEVIVVGGGPAGATAAGLLAQGGRRVLVLERERFPRFHIGESLMPETFWTFQRLGFLERMKRSDFTRKHGLQFISSAGEASPPFYFAEHNQHESTVTWQVERAEFDKMLLDHAAECGAEVREGYAVKDVLFEGQRAVGVRAARMSPPELGCEPDGPAEEIRAQVVIDASGQSALLARRLNLLRKDPRLARAAVFAHFENGRRDPGIDEGTTLVVHAEGNRGWLWYIPLHRNRVSVGAVGAPADILKGRASPEEALKEQIAGSIEIRRRLANARRVSPVRAARDYSYQADRCAGDGWVLCGDASGFLDPIYCSGVFLALKSGELAADAVEDALGEGDASAERLGAFGPRYRQGTDALRKLVYAFYTPGFSFNRLLTEHPEHRRALADVLIGDVFKEGVDEVLRDLQRCLHLPEERLADPASSVAAETS